MLLFRNILLGEKLLQLFYNCWHGIFFQKTKNNSCATLKNRHLRSMKIELINGWTAKQAHDYFVANARANGKENMDLFREYVRIAREERSKAKAK